MKKLVLGIAALAVVALVSAPAMAATEWNFGGMIRYMTFWDQTDSGDFKMTDLEGGGKSLDSDGRLQWGTQANTRLMMWMNSDNLEGFIELGYDTDENKVWPREYWGKYKFSDKWSVTMGQQHQLYNSFISRQGGLVDLNLNGIGTAFRPPTPKIVFTYGGVGHLWFIPSGFSFALVKPEKVEDLWGSMYGPADIDTYLPQLQAAYSYYADTWRVKLAGAYQYMKYNDLDFGTTTKDKGINTWLFTVDGDVAFGPLWLAANVTIGQNWGNAGMMNSEFGATQLGSGLTGGTPLDMAYISAAQFDGTKLKNTTSWMASIVAAYQLTEALRFEAGAGYRGDDNKMYDKSKNQWSVYLQAAYTVAPGFEIVPEIGYVDRGNWIMKDNGKTVDSGYLWYAGAQWNMYF